MEESYSLLQDMAIIQSFIANIECELQNNDLSDETRAEFQARQHYLIRHLRVATTILQSNLDGLVTTNDSRMTPLTKEKLKDMNLERATHGVATFESKTMRKINQRIDENKLKSFK